MKKEKEYVKLYVTKYLFTNGILEVNCTISDGGYAYGKLDGRYYESQFSPKDFYYTLDEARVDAELKRTKKITVVKKQLAKLEKLTF